MSVARTPEKPRTPRTPQTPPDNPEEENLLNALEDLATNEEKRPISVYIIRSILEANPEAAKRVWACPEAVDGIINEFVKIVIRFANGQQDPEFLQYGFHLLGIFLSFVKDPDLIRDFVDSHLPMRLVRLMFVQSTSRLTYYRASLAMIILKILDTGENWSARWFVMTEVMEEILRTIVNTDTWEVAKVCLIVVLNFCRTDFGLYYIAKLSPRFHAIDFALTHTLDQLAQKTRSYNSDDIIIYRIIIRIYDRLADDRRLLRILAYADLNDSLRVYNKRITDHDGNSAEVYASFHEKLSRYKMVLPSVNLFPYYGTVMGVKRPNNRSTADQFKYLHEQLKVNITWLNQPLRQGKAPSNSMPSTPKPMYGPPPAFMHPSTPLVSMPSSKNALMGQPIVHGHRQLPNGLAFVR